MPNNNKKIYQPNKKPTKTNEQTSQAQWSIISSFIIKTVFTFIRGEEERRLRNVQIRTGFSKGTC